MKYFKTFNLFESTPTVNSWSIKDSRTAHIFNKIFGGLSFGLKERKLKNIAKEYDEYLEVVYQSYLKEKSKTSNTQPAKEEEFTDKPNVRLPEPKPQEVQSKPIQKPEINKEQASKDNKDFQDLGHDITEIQGLLQNSKSPEEVNSHLATLKKMGEQTQKEIDELLKQIHDGDDVEDISDLHDKKKERLDKINAILKKVKPKPISPKPDSAHFESVDWTGGAIKAPEAWAEEDKKSITAKVNSYKIEEFSLRKKGLIDSVEDQKKVKKLEHDWLVNINNIHKKWFYIFEITKLDDKYKTTTKKESPTAIKSAKTLEILKTSFNEKANIIHSVNEITFGKGYYVLSNFNNDLILLFKIHGAEKLFKVVGSLNIDDKRSKIDYFDSDKSNFVWNVNTNKYRDFKKDTFITTDDGVQKFKLRMTSDLGKDFPCIEAKNVAGYTTLVSYFKDGDTIKKNEVSIRDVNFSLYNVVDTNHIDIKEPIEEISAELKKSL